MAETFRKVVICRSFKGEFSRNRMLFSLFFFLLKRVGERAENEMLVNTKKVILEGITFFVFTKYGRFLLRIIDGFLF